MIIVTIMYKWLYYDVYHYYYDYIYTDYRSTFSYTRDLTSTEGPPAHPLHPAAVRCDMVLHRAFCARHVRTNGIGGEVRHGVTSGISCGTSLNNYVRPHLHREYEGVRDAHTSRLCAHACMAWPRIRVGTCEYVWVNPRPRECHVAACPCVRLSVCARVILEIMMLTVWRLQSKSRSKRRRLSKKRVPFNLRMRVVNPTVPSGSETSPSGALMYGQSPY